MIRDEVYLTMMANPPPIALTDAVASNEGKSVEYEVGSELHPYSAKAFRHLI